MQQSFSGNCFCPLRHITRLKVPRYCALHGKGNSFSVQCLGNIHWNKKVVHIELLAPSLCTKERLRPRLSVQSMVGNPPVYCGEGGGMSSPRLEVVEPQCYSSSHTPELGNMCDRT